MFAKHTSVIEDDDATSEQGVGTAYWDQMWNEGAADDEGDDE